MIWSLDFSHKGAYLYGMFAVRAANIKWKLISRSTRQENNHLCHMSDFKKGDILAVNTVNIGSLLLMILAEKCWHSCWFSKRCSCL